MSDDIDLLERLGQDAKFHGASAEQENVSEVEASRAVAGVKRAILAGDAPALRAAMGQSSLVSLVMPAEEEEQGEEEKEGDGLPIPQSPPPDSCK